MNEHFTTQSKLLGQFYRDWLEARATTLSGGTKPAWFSPWTGLCYNLEKWCEAHGIPRYPYEEEMWEQFRAAGLDPVYPFHDGSSATYEAGNGKHLHNEARLAWAAAHAAE